MVDLQSILDATLNGHIPIDTISTFDLTPFAILVFLFKSKKSSKSFPFLICGVPESSQLSGRKSSITEFGMQDDIHNVSVYYQRVSSYQGQ
jgi:hypothetical protein